MKNNYYHFLFFFVGLLCFSLSLEAQSHRVQKPYLDASTGGLFLPGEGLGLNGHFGIGYQFSAFAGLGVGFTVSTDVTNNSPRNFSGLGLEYRINVHRLFIKNTFGWSLREDFATGDEFTQYERISGQSYLFYRGAIGFKPLKGILNVGLAVNFASGTFDRLACDFNALENCVSVGDYRRMLISPQLYFGLSFPKTD